MEAQFSVGHPRFKLNQILGGHWKLYKKVSGQSVVRLPLVLQLFPPSPPFELTTRGGLFLYAEGSGDTLLFLFGLVLGLQGDDLKRAAADAINIPIPVMFNVRVYVQYKNGTDVCSCRGRRKRGRVTRLTCALLLVWLKREGNVCVHVGGRGELHLYNKREY